MQRQYSVLDTLVYLFDYFVYEKKGHPSIAEMHKQLGAAGFDQQEIDRAMSWLTHLNDLQKDDSKVVINDSFIRQFSKEENAKITFEGQGFIHKLMQMGILDANLREILIHKLMGLDEEEIGELEINWVMLMALYNKPNQEANTVWLKRSLINSKTLH